MVALPIINPAALNNYDDLLAAVADWLDRDDLTAAIPGFVVLAEARFNRELRTLWQIVRTTFDITDSPNALPAGFRNLKRLSIVDSPDHPLFEISPQAAAQRFSGCTGTPVAYYLEGRTLYILPPPGGPTTLDMTYLSAIPALNSAAQSNWLLAEHADLYLFATMFEAAVYIRDQDAISYLTDRVSSVLQSIKLASRRDTHGAGPIIPQSPLQVRGGRC